MTMNPVQEALHLFGLSQHEQDVYFLLIKHPWSTVLALSRKTEVKRSTLYRILESLHKKGIVEFKLDNHTTYYAAADSKTFESLVIDQESRAKKLRSSLSLLQSHLNQEKQGKVEETQVRFFRGIRGLQIMNWNSCQDKNITMYILGDNRWPLYLGQDFSEEIREEYVHQHIQVRELLGKNALQPIPENSDVPWTKNKTYIREQFRHRVIPKDVLDIQREIIILPKKIYLFGYAEEPIGIEITNSGYAQMFTQMFRALWNQAQSVDVFGGEDL